MNLRILTFIKGTAALMGGEYQGSLPLVNKKEPGVVGIWSALLHIQSNQYKTSITVTQNNYL